MENEENIRQAARRIAGASRITMITGAGVSAASGVPTFRDADGLWKSYSPGDLATPEAFRRNPALVWEWYDWRRGIIARCSPNQAHHVIAEWSRRIPGFSLITQNVDGLHEKAGARNVIRFHGSIWEVFCVDRCAASPPRWRDETVPFPLLPPTCPYCGGLIRPGVVWFGEGLDAGVLQKTDAVLECDVFLTVGTSALVYPAAGLVMQAAAIGAYTIEINLESTPSSSSVDLAIKGPAEIILPQINDTM
ncbi:MAG TPA: NAD-dependent deacylase [Acidobacteriota bacterium]|nr:NAD-dependent deacylase [Acidobacteriota bacterium]